MATSTESTDAELCYLLDKIPPEVGNEIYELVLVKDLPIDVASYAYANVPSDDPRWDFRNSDSSVYKWTNDAAEPGLLRTCSQIRKEALSVFYSQNVFFVEDTNGGFECVRWLGALTPEKRSMINYIRFHSYNDRPKGKVPPAACPVHLARRWLKSEGIEMPENVLYFYVRVEENGNRWSGKGCRWTNGPIDEADPESLEECTPNFLKRFQRFHGQLQQ